MIIFTFMINLFPILQNENKNFINFDGTLLRVVCSQCMSQV